MADTSVFSRLRRLFSTDVVIRNVGGNQICSPYPYCISQSDINQQDTSNCP